MIESQYKISEINTYLEVKLTNKWTIINLRDACASIRDERLMAGYYETGVM